METRSLQRSWGKYREMNVDRAVRYFKAYAQFKFPMFEIGTKLEEWDFQLTLRWKHLLVHTECISLSAGTMLQDIPIDPYLRSAALELEEWIDMEPWGYGNYLRLHLRERGTGQCSRCGGVGGLWQIGVLLKQPLFCWTCVLPESKERVG